jgi:hypothetical protein
VENERSWKDRIIATEKTTKELQAKVDRIDENTRELVDLFRNAKGGAAFILGLAKVAQVVGSIGVAVAVVWGLVYAYLHGTPPQMPKP